MNSLAGSVIPLVCLGSAALAQVEQEAYFKAFSPGNSERFGSAVAMSGDTLVVGAEHQSDGFPTNSGAVYVFRRVGTSWVEEAFLKAFVPDTSDKFGAAVAIDGDTLVVGAPDEDSPDSGIDPDLNVNQLSNTGAVFVFTRSGTTWTGQAAIKPANVGLNHFFGASVALVGDELLVGCPGERGAVTGVGGDPDAAYTPKSGAAYLFERDGTVWTQEAYIKASNTGAEDRFGTAVAFDGDTLLIGAPEEDSNATGVGGDQFNNGSLDSGAVYVFARTGTTWAQEAYLKSVGPMLFNTEFGRAVSLSGDTALIGGRDKAEIFERSGTTWSPLVALESADPAVLPAGFGNSVSIDGDTAAVGASFDRSSASGINGQICNADLFFVGAVLLYRRTAGVWSPTTYIKAGTSGALDEFGHAVHVDGNRLAVGAVRESSDGAGVNGVETGESGAQGAAYVFDLASAAINPAGPACDLFESVCAGDGGDQMGCTDCPCNNNSSVDGGCLNSAGTAGVLSPSGVPSVGDLSLRFEAAGLPPSITALLISGQALAPTNPQNPCFGLDSGVNALQLDGLRCAVLNAERHGARQSDANGEVGVTTPGWGDPDGFFNTNAFVVGAERHFQIFYRDDDTQVCMTGQNTTQAISTTFLP